MCAILCPRFGEIVKWRHSGGLRTEVVVLFVDFVDRKHCSQDNAVAHSTAVPHLTPDVMEAIVIALDQQLELELELL